MNELTEKELISFTQKLIQTPSLSKQEEEISKIVEEEMKRLNYDEVWRDKKSNVIGKIKGKGNGPVLLFNGHIDHAGVGSMEEPFSGKIIDGSKYGYDGKVIYGRGASDMKSAVAAMVYAGGRIKEQGIDLNGDVLVTAVVMEEMAYGEGIKHLLDHKGITADFAVSGEATNLNVYLGHRGKIEFNIAVKGKTSHAGYPQAGINAISQMNKFINAVKTHYSLPSHHYLGSATYTFIDIAASPGRLTPIVPDYCELIFDRRFFPEETENFLKSELWDIVETIKKEDSNFEADISTVKHFPAMFTEPEEKIVKAVQLARKNVLGDKGKLGSWYFGVDGTFLNLYGIPCVGFGPADEHFAHTPEDHVPMEHIDIAARVYEQLIKEVCG